MSTINRNKINANGIDPDKAISRKEEDRLGRQPLAGRIADLINNLDDDYKDSVVIGIEGEWGSGKSSFINLILNLVDPESLESEEFVDHSVESKEEEELDENVRVNKRNVLIEFNPWNFSDQGELVKDFFGSIAEKLLENGDDMVSKFRRFVSKLKPSEITLSPSVSVGEISGKGFEAKWKLDGEEDLGESLQKQRDDIDESIKKLERRIIIVIDDIDRLDSAETKLIFKLVKLTANFDNTVFILAYDRNRVGERLTENNIDGEEYLKKIVQLPFLLPKPAQEDIHRELTKAIKAELKGRGVQEIGARRLHGLINSQAFKELFPTVRDVKRYANSLHLDLKVLRIEEVNPVDFVGVEAIRVFAPEVYLAMTNEKTTFTDSEYYEYGSRSRESESHKRQKSILEGILAKAPEKLKGSIKDIIQQLFPKVKELYATGESSGEWEQFHREERIHREELRACSDEFFDKYFLLSVPSKFLSEMRVKEFLSVIKTPAATMSKLKEFQEEGKLSLLIERLPERSGGLDPQRQENMLMCLFKFVDVEGIMSENLVRASVRSGLKIEEDKEGQIQLAHKVVKDTGMLFVTTLLVQELNRVYDVEAYNFARLFSDLEMKRKESEIELLNRVYVDKINEAAKNNSLITSNGLGDTLSFWKKLDERRARDYITKLLETKEGLFAFIEGTSQYVSSERGFGNLISRREIFERMKKLNLNPDQLTEKESRMINSILPMRRTRYWGRPTRARHIY